MTNTDSVPKKKPQDPRSLRARIAAEIARYTRRPSLRDYEITIRIYAQANALKYSQAITELDHGWREGHLLRRKVHNNGTWKWAYAPTHNVPDDLRHEYDAPPDTTQ